MRKPMRSIEARTRAGLTQDELASRMDTSRTVIARLESGRRGKPSPIFVPEPEEQR